jgi:hypothetical protein
MKGNSDVWVPLEKRKDSSKERGKVLLRFTKTIAVIDNYGFNCNFNHNSKTISITDANSSTIPFLIEGKWNKEWRVKDSSGQKILLSVKVILEIPMMLIG